jgi:Protein of unknown function (DUF2845)
MKKALIGLIVMMVSVAQASANSLYCPKNTRFIKIGMTQADVIQACGQPLNKSQGSKPATRKVEVKQLMYHSLSGKTAFYGPYEITTGSAGTQVTISIKNNKVSDISLNGASSNAFSLCYGNSVAIGAPESAVYNACGSPSAVNKTFINVPTGQSQKISVWTYQLYQYQPAVRLTFVNGKLQSMQ